MNINQARMHFERRAGTHLLHFKWRRAEPPGFVDGIKYLKYDEEF